MQLHPANNIIIHTNNTGFYAQLCIPTLLLLTLSCHYHTAEYYVHMYFTEYTVYTVYYIVYNVRTVYTVYYIVYNVHLHHAASHAHTDL